MNMRDAVGYVFQDPNWPRKAGKIALVAAVPLFGQLWAMGYVLRVLQGLLRDDDAMPDAELSTGLLWDGLRVALVTLLTGVVVALLAAPLFFMEPDKSRTAVVVPALVQAFNGPTSLLVTAVSAAVTAVITVRLALTNSLERALRPFEFWALLRAEPALWIACAVIGWIAIEGPYAIVWALPLRGDLDIAAMIAASSLAWTFGQLVNAHLSFQAYNWAKRTAAMRAAGVRYRW